MSVERGPARWGAVAVIPGRVVAGGQLVKLHPNCRIATLISRDEVATSAEGMYGSLRHLVKPILEKISVATRTWTASLKPTNSSLVPTSLKTCYPRSLLLTAWPLCLHFAPVVTGGRTDRLGTRHLSSRSETQSATGAGRSTGAAGDLRVARDEDGRLSGRAASGRTELPDSQLGRAVERETFEPPEPPVHVEPRPVGAVEETRPGPPAGFQEGLFGHRLQGRHFHQQGLQRRYDLGGGDGAEQRRLPPVGVP